MLVKSKQLFKGGAVASQVHGAQVCAHNIDK